MIDSGRCPAPFNMALDEALALSVRKGDSPAVLRLYGWERPSITLGRFQKTADIDLGYCMRKGIPVVRRPTGGRAVLHDEELTYSFSSGTAGRFARGLRDSYRLISDAVSQALRDIGLAAEVKGRPEKGHVLAGSPLCFQSSSFGEILLNDRKVAGAAQRRWPEGLLQQGSLAYHHNTALLHRICGAGELDRCMGGIREALPGLEEERLKTALIEAFEDRFAVRLDPSAPTREETHLAQSLLERKYLLDSWNQVLPTRGPGLPQETD